MEIIFQVRDAAEGGYFAQALGVPVFTQADTWEELRDNVRMATARHFEERAERPTLIRLTYSEVVSSKASKTCFTTFG